MEGQETVSWRELTSEGSGQVPQGEQPVSSEGKPEKGGTTRKEIAEPSGLVSNGLKSLDVEGAVLWPPAYNFNWLEFLRIRAYNGDVIVAESEVGRDGGWTFADISWEGQLRFETHSGGLVRTSTEVFDQFPEGGVLAVQIEPPVAYDVWFICVGPEGKDLMDTWVEVEALDSDFRVRTNARDDGYLHVEGCPAGAYQVTAGRTSFATSYLSPFFLPLRERNAQVVVLSSGRTISGRCLRGGEGVESFEISWWPAMSNGKPTRRQFGPKSGGEFLLQDAPIGPLRLLASAEEFGVSELAFVEAGSDDEVIFELLDPVLMKGRVVSAETGEPIGRCIVRPVLIGSDGSVTAQLPGAVRCDSEGRFECAASAVSRLGLQVVAGGDLAEHVQPIARGSSIVDLGDVAVERAARLALELMPSAADPESVFLTGRGQTVIPPTPFGPDGKLELYPIVDPVVRYLVEFPDGAVFLSSLNVRMGETTSSQVPIGDCHLDVTTGDLDAMPIELHLTPPRGGAIVGYMEGGKVSYRNLQPGSYQAEAFASGSRRLYSRQVIVSPEGAQLVLTKEAPTKVYLRDSTGAPLSGTTVLLRPLDGGAVQGRHLIADDGALEIPRGKGFEAIAFGGKVGVATNIELLPSLADEDTITVPIQTELVVEASRGDGTPIQGASVTVKASGLFLPLGPPLGTDEVGRVSVRTTPDSRFRLSVAKPGHWTHFEDDVAPGYNPVVLYELADLQIEVRNQNGVGLADVPIEVEWLLGKELVSEWITKLELATSSESMLTGDQGTWSVRRVPSGIYSIKVPGLDAFEVELSKDSTAFEVVLP